MPTKTKQEAVNETVASIRNEFQAEIDSIDSQIQTAITNGDFSLFLQYVPDKRIQLYFRDGFGYKIAPKEVTEKLEQEGDITYKGMEISWNVIPPIETLILKCDESQIN